MKGEPPSDGSLYCTGATDFSTARATTAAGPYSQSAHARFPGSLNATVASMAVTMFLAAVAGVPSAARLVHYNGMTGGARASMISPQSDCIACSRSGALARANEWPLPARLS